MSKELEALEQLKAIKQFDGGEHHFLGDEKEIKIVEKGLKALDIIIKKNVDILELKFAYSVYEYNVTKQFGEILTEEEFKLLKEVLCYE